MSVLAKLSVLLNFRVFTEFPCFHCFDRNVRFEPDWVGVFSKMTVLTRVLGLSDTLLFRRGFRHGFSQ